VFCSLLCVLFAACSSSASIGKTTVGLENQQLSECPNRPNCVSTFASKKRNTATPWPYIGSAAEAKAQVEQLCASMDGVTLQSSTANYLHYTFETKLGSFTDDVEFYFNDENKKVHYRSASRVGYGDFGANKRRMKKLGKLFQ